MSKRQLLFVTAAPRRQSLSLSCSFWWTYRLCRSSFCVWRSLERWRSSSNCPRRSVYSRDRLSNLVWRSSISGNNTSEIGFITPDLASSSQYSTPMCVASTREDMGWWVPPPEGHGLLCRYICQILSSVGVWMLYWDPWAAFHFSPLSHKVGMWSYCSGWWSVVEPLAIYILVPSS